MVSSEVAEVIVKALACGIAAEALVLDVANKVAFNQSQLQRMADKVVDLKNKIINQKLEIKAIWNKREETPTTIFTAKPSAPVTKKKKSLDYPKRLSDSKNSSFKF